MKPITPAQGRWRERFEAAYTFGIPVQQPAPEVVPKERGAIMATKLTLPARSNAIDYSDEQVTDIVLSLHDAVKGQGVVVDDAQDTEAKARVRCRTMADKVKADQRPTVAAVLAMEFDNINPLDEFFTQDADGNEVTLTFDDNGNVTGATNDKGKTIKDANADNLYLAVPGVNVKTHTVQQGEGEQSTWLPVLSVKP